MKLNQFHEIWIMDFEFCAPPGNRPSPVCLVATEFRSGKKLRIWKDELEKLVEPPYLINRDSLCVGYFTSAEWGCHLALGWGLPNNVLDLFAEFRNLTNGKSVPSGNSLLGACAYFGLSGITAEEKQANRKLAQKNCWTLDEKRGLLTYCESDVDATIRLFKKMIPVIDLSYGLIRGQYMKAVASMEWIGIPIDTLTLEKLEDSWEQIAEQLIYRVDKDFGVNEGQTFKLDRFRQYLKQKNIPWPKTPTGMLSVSDETFKDMALTYPEITPLRHLRKTLSQMRLRDLQVGDDGYNRTLLSPFRSRSGRNQPSNAKFIFGFAKWLRGLIKPKVGNALIMIDWEQQEFAIGAALSKDEAMIQAYESGDPYVAFAQQTGAIPPNGNAETHPEVRALYKIVVLALQYGMGEYSLAKRIKKQPIYAQDLIASHKNVFKKFWRWSKAAVDIAMLGQPLIASFGWTLHPGNNRNNNSRSLSNHPIQSNGGEMMRLASCYLTEAGIEVCAPIHDAFLIQAPLDEVDGIHSSAKEAMARASRDVLNGFEIRTDSKIIRYPDRYMDPLGRQMWDQVMEILTSLEE